jgi:hypothetical protein
MKKISLLIVLFISLLLYGFSDLMLWIGVDMNSLKFPLIASFVVPIVVFTAVICVGLYWLYVLKSVMGEKNSQL